MVDASDRRNRPHAHPHPARPRPPAASDERAATAHPLLALQRAIGNRAVRRLLGQTSMLGNPAARRVVAGMGGGPIRRAITAGKLNIVGEDHDMSGPNRGPERAMLREKYGIANYWTEPDFAYSVDGEEQAGDSPTLRAAWLTADLLSSVDKIRGYATTSMKEHIEGAASDEELESVLGGMRWWLENAEASSGHLRDELASLPEDGKNAAVDASAALDHIADCLKFSLELLGMIDRKRFKEQLQGGLRDIAVQMRVGRTWSIVLLSKLDYLPGDNERPDQLVDRARQDRSRHMYEAAGRSGKTGVWKVGEYHIPDMPGHAASNPAVALTPRAEFDQEVAEWMQGAEAEQEVNGPKGDTSDEPLKERKQEAQIEQEAEESKGDAWDELESMLNEWK